MLNSSCEIVSKLLNEQTLLETFENDIDISYR